MKIKIKGDITPETLLQAFTEVLNSIPHYRDNPDLYRIRGMTLYFNFWSKNFARNVVFCMKENHLRM